MKAIRLTVDGQVVVFSPPAAVVAGQPWVPLTPFCKQVGATLERTNGGQRFVICRGDRCLPLDEGDAITLEETHYAHLPTLADALGLACRWREAAGEAHIATDAAPSPTTGLRPGSMAPDFTLPGLYSGQPVSLSDYGGKKVLVFAWASW